MWAQVNTLQLLCIHSVVDLALGQSATKYVRHFSTVYHFRPIGRPNHWQFDSLSLGQQWQIWWLIASACLTGTLDLTLRCPLLPYGYSYKASCAVICKFWRLGIMILNPEHQSAQMSKITNDSAGCFIAAVPIWQQWASKGLCCAQHLAVNTTGRCWRHGSWAECDFTSGVDWAKTSSQVQQSSETVSSFRR